MHSIFLPPWRGKMLSWSSCAAVWESLLANPKIRLVRGEARFVEARTVEVDGERYEADDVIIAVGSVPAMLPIEGCDLPEVLTSREILSLDVLPKRLCVVGGGVIGLNLPRCSTLLAAK